MPSSANARSAPSPTRRRGHGRWPGCWSRAGGSESRTSSLRPGHCPLSLVSGAAAWIACLGGALPASGYEAILRSAGLRLVAAENHGEALVAMIDSVEARLLALVLAGLPAVMTIDARQVREVAEVARRAVAGGAAGYALLVAEKTAPD